VLPRHLPGVTEENNENCHNSRCLGRDTNHVPPKCNLQVLPPKTLCSINLHEIQLLWYEKHRANLSDSFCSGVKRGLPRNSQVHACSFSEAVISDYN
jgi:hypothetical protein